MPGWSTIIIIIIILQSNDWFMSTTHSIIITTRCAKLLCVAVYSTSRTAFHRQQVAEYSSRLRPDDR